MIRALFIAFLLTGCASLEQRANTAAIADGGTTLAGLALGAAEMNPLGLATIAIKYPLLQYIKTLPADEQAQYHASASAIWGGAAVNNLCVIAAIVTGGAFAPVCLAAGVAYTVYAWTESQVERDFWAGCMEYRRVSGETFRCVYGSAS